MQDSRAHNHYYDETLGRDVMAGFFGDVFEIMREKMNFTYESQNN